MVGGISTGITLIVAINVINTSVLANFQRTIDLIAGPAALEVTLGVGEVGFSEAVVGAVRADPGVLAAMPLVRGTISLADDPGETLQLFGVDLTAEEDLRRYHVAATTDRREILRWMAEPRSILVTTEFARGHHVAPGQSIRLSSPGGVDDFVVRGLLETEGLAAAFGGQLAVMDLPAAQLLLAKQERIDQIDVVLREGADVGAVQERLRVALPESLSVAPPAQRGAQYESILASFQAMLTGLSLLCLIAGVYIVYNTTSTGAVHRAMVMAGLRVIGAEPAQLFRLLMLEAVVLGAIGTLGGISIGMVLAQLLSGMVRDSMGIIFQLRFPLAGLAVHFSQLIPVAGLGVATAVFSSFFAARRVAQLDPLDAIRPRARSTAVPVPQRQLVFWWIVLIGISAAALVAEEHFKSIAWGNFGATLWNASVIVIAVPLVSWMATLLLRVLPILFGAEGRVAADSLLRSPTRTGVTAAAIALVLTVAIMLSSLSLSFRKSMSDYLGKFLAADLGVSAVATEGGWLETAVPDSLASELRQVPGVKSVETLRVLPGQLYQGLRISIGGLSDGFFDPERYPPHWYREGDPQLAAKAIRSGSGANISTGLADRTGLHVGDQIALDTPTGPLILPIVGVVPDYASDRGSVIVSRRLMIERWNESTVNRINLTLEPSASLETVRARIAERFADRYRLKILSLRDMLTYHDEKINRAFAFTKAIQLLVAIVTVAGIFDLLVSAITERRRELALWRVIGADERTVRRSVVIESATTGSLGAMLGVVVGLVTAWMWISINFRYLLGYYLERHFAVGAASWYIVLVLLMTMLAGYAAARRATRQDIIESLQNE